MPQNEESDTKTKTQDLFLEDLRLKSLRKGGFGEARVDIWPKLLHVSRKKAGNAKPPADTPVEEKPPHQDERQIGLDTDRSFVLYPVEPRRDREILQADLHQLLVSLFRKRPRLSYFQGYHDIVTVFFLTLPPELQLVCVEKLSLHRLRDSMGSGLEPVLGLLRVTQNLLRLADPDFAQLLERNSPLPFYALSNLLTLFSHDMPTLPLIQHVFDYLLCRPPIAVVYLATAIILARKQEVIRLEEEDEDGMIHSLLSSLPNLVDDVDDLENPPFQKTEDHLEDVGNTFIKEEDSEPSAFLEPIETCKAENSVGSAIGQPAPEDTLEIKADIIPTLDKDSLSKEHHQSVTDDEESLSKEHYQSVIDDEESLSSLHASNSRIPGEVNVSISDPVKIEQEDLPYPSPLPNPKHMDQKLFLTDLLKHADALYNEYPPSHSGLSLSSIMGPQSVVFTWSESHSGLPSDNTAEAMVSHPELVVYPYVESDVDQKERDDSGETNAGKQPRRRRHKLKKSPFGQVEKKTMLAGTVLVLGVAMAMYGMRTRNNNGGLLFGITESRHSGPKDWKRLSGWVGGAFAGMSEKIMTGLSSGP